MEQKKPIVSLEVRVHWGDMDAMQHVNNIIYFKMGRIYPSLTV